MDYLLVIRVNYKIKNSYLNNYSKTLFCQAIVLIFSLVIIAFCEANCFNFHSNQGSFFVKYIKFEKPKALKKT